MKLLVFLLLPYLSLSEVGLDFNQCKEFFLNGVPPQITPPTDDSVKHICQCVWYESDQKRYVYATLYSTTWRIPIYSAYKFESHRSIGRCDAWYIEPQLDPGNTEPCMSPKGTSINNQAVNSDYDKSDYDKGHLYPVQHTNSHLFMLATSTLTNAAPQNSTFNRGAWKTHEKAVIGDLKDCKSKAYVVTGVVPDIKNKIPKNNPKNNPRVTVSKYYWRATCCLKNRKFTGQGYFGPNNNDKVELLTIADLQKMLEKDYNLFFSCPRSINNQAVNRDYDKSEKHREHKYDRGHLYPVQHTNNHLSMLATSTLTNAAPQDPTFNRQEWNYHEEAVIDDLEDTH